MVVWLGILGGLVVFGIISYFILLHKAKCPNCKSIKYVVPLVYGMPSQKAFEEYKETPLKDKKFVYAMSCCKGEHQYYCKKCQCEF